MITIISATHREESLTAKVADIYSEFLNQLNIENQVFYLKDLPKDFLFTNFYGSSTEPFVEMVNLYFDKVDKFIVVSPEYHGSYPGVFKSLFDCIGGEMIKEKKVALVGVATGRIGNLRGMDHLTALFHHLKAEVYSAKPKISQVHRLLDESGKLNDDETEKVIKSQLKGFLAF
jgi:NAD(P)H-dependent FMN reductase